ncbi:MAG: hypothetical protein ACJAXR_001941 [Halopseudomonas sp.]|jgi:hypothetical protein
MAANSLAEDPDTLRLIRLLADTRGGRCQSTACASGARCHQPAAHAPTRPVG